MVRPDQPESTLLDHHNPRHNLVQILARKLSPRSGPSVVPPPNQTPSWFTRHRLGTLFKECCDEICSKKKGHDCEMEFPQETEQKRKKRESHRW